MQGADRTGSGSAVKEFYMKRRKLFTNFWLMPASILLIVGCTQPIDTNTSTGVPPTKTETKNPYPSTDLLGVPKSGIREVNNTASQITGEGEMGAFISYRTVVLDLYSIGQYEVTRELWVLVMSRMYDDLLSVRTNFLTEIADRKPLLSQDSSSIPIPDYGYDINHSTEGQWNIKANKASALTEYLGGKAYGVAGDHMDYPTMEVTYKYNDAIVASNKGYLSYANRSLPMGNIQWHEAIVFCNYLSILQGLMPVYELDRFMSWRNDWAGLVPFTAYDTPGARAAQRFGKEGIKWGSAFAGDARNGWGKYISTNLYLPLKNQNGSLVYTAWDPDESQADIATYWLFGTEDNSGYKKSASPAEKSRQTCPAFKYYRRLA